MYPSCPGVPVVRQISPAQLGRELQEILARAGMQGTYDLYLSPAKDRDHQVNCRNYAQVTLGARKMEVTRAMLTLPPEHRRGLLAHEVGHWLDPEASEDGADRAAEAFMGEPMIYDMRWPGKGLQCMMGRRLNPRETIEVEASVDSDLDLVARMMVDRVEVGRLSASEVDESQLDAQCRRDLDQLAVNVGRPIDRAVVVDQSIIVPDYRGRGWGPALYGTAIDALTDVAPDAALVQGGCGPELYDETTRAARRVWTSPRLADMVEVRGAAAVGQRPGRQPTPHVVVRRYTNVT